MKRLKEETSGLRGEVLKQASPERFQQKLDELVSLNRRYFHYFYSAEQATLP
jgi:hypothetical protein